MKYLLSFISLAVFVACHSHGGLQQVKRQDKPCPCDTASSQCPSHRLDEGSLCACLNQAEMFCWYRNNRQCASPIPKQCPGAPQTVPSPAPTAPTKPKFTPPYGQGIGGLNCVEIGYCSRATRSKTSTTITVNGTAVVITVPVGLPTGDTAPDPFAPPVPAADGIQFTELPGAAPIDSTPQMTPPPRLRNKERDVEEAKAEEKRWAGNGM